MNEKVLGYALHTLDTQYKHFINYQKDRNPHAADQEAYYNGMFRMLELIVSDAFSTTIEIERCDDNKHYIIGGPENE